MPKILVPITKQTERALLRKVRLAGTGSITREIQRAITQYLAGPRSIEAAFMKLLGEKAPKELPVMLTQLKKTNTKLDRSLTQLKAWQRQRMSLERIDPTEVAQMALETFESAKTANDWFNRPNRALALRTPLSLLTSQAGVKRVKIILGRVSRKAQTDHK